MEWASGDDCRWIDSFSAAFNGSLEPYLIMMIIMILCICNTVYVTQLFTQYNISLMLLVQHSKPNN